MSEPTEPWKLVNWDDTLDLGIAEIDGEEVQQYRHHYIFERSRLLTETEVGNWASQIGTAITSISASLSGTEFTRTLSTGKLICVKNRVVPYSSPQEPIAFGREEQAWEVYGPWADVPEAWEWDNTPVIGGGT